MRVTTLLASVGLMASLGSIARTMEPMLGPVDVDGSSAPINPRLLRRFQAVTGQGVPAAVAAPAVVELGRMLWFEPRLSADGGLSCNSCHDLQTWGVDGKAVSTGHRGKQGRRNTPSVSTPAGALCSSGMAAPTPRGPGPRANREPR